MAVKMRLRREGKKKQPFYRVVVADSRSPRDGRYIEDIGFYQPTHDPSTINIDGERALYWLRNGAQPSEPVLKLLRIQGVWEEFKPGDTGRDRSEANARKAAQRAARDEVARKAEQEQAAARAAAAAPAEDPVEEAPAEAVEQAVAEDTQPAPGEPEETGALPEKAAGETAAGEGEAAEAPAEAPAEEAAEAPATEAPAEEAPATEAPAEEAAEAPADAEEKAE